VGITQTEEERRKAGRREQEIKEEICVRTYIHTHIKGKAVPLHAIEELGGREGIAPTYSRPRH
jgi:hypothetical protein